jgi:predicted Zn-dependent protease
MLSLCYVTILLSYVVKQIYKPQIYNKEIFLSIRTYNKKIRITVTLRFKSKFHIVLFLLLISSFFHSRSANLDASIQQSSMDHNSIDLCCRWDEQISDEVLKYKLINMQEEQRNEIRKAFDEWNKHLTALRLIEINSHDQMAEIVVKLGNIDNRKNSNQLVENKEVGQTAGQSINNLNHAGYIANATIILSNEIFVEGSDSSTLFPVILHEIGHVLGLGHANFDDLMNPLVSGDMDEVSVCDAKGVVKANEMTVKKKALPSPQAYVGDTNIIHC